MQEINWGYLCTVKGVRQVQDLKAEGDGPVTTWTYKLEAVLGAVVTVRSTQKLGMVTGDVVRVELHGIHQTSLTSEEEDAADDAAFSERVREEVKDRIRQGALPNAELVEDAPKKKARKRGRA